MMTALAYFAVAAACLWVCHRRILHLSRGAAIALLLLPLCSTGRALLSGRVYAPIDLPFASAPLRSVASAVGVDRPRNPILSDVYCLNIPWKYAVRVAYT